MRSVNLVFAAVLTVISPQIAAAAFITSIGSTYGSATVNSPASVTWTGGLISAQSPGSGLVGATTSDLTVGSLGTFINVFTGINVGTGSATPSTYTVTLAGQTATFNLTSPFNIVTTTNNLGTVMFTTQASLVSTNIPVGVADLSLFTAGNGGGTFTFSAPGILVNAGNPGQFFQPGNNQSTITGSVVLTSNSALAIPEPGSMFLFGSIVAAGCVVGRLRLQRNRAVC